MTKISATLPLDAIRGTVKQRYSNIKLANKNLFNKLMETPEDLSLQRAGELLSEAFVPDTGYRLNVKVLPLDRSDATGLTQTTFVDGKPIGYTIMVPTRDNGIIDKADIPHFMHEATHVHQQVFEPKIMARISSLDLTPKEEKRVAVFYENVLNTEHLFGHFDETLAALRMKFALRGLDDKEKLKVMDLMKNNVRMEYLAHSEGEKYSAKLSQAGIKSNGVSYLDDFLFDEKITFMEKQMAKHLAKMRKK